MPPVMAIGLRHHRTLRPLRPVVGGAEQGRERKAAPPPGHQIMQQGHRRGSTRQPRVPRIPGRIEKRMRARRLRIGQEVAERASATAHHVVRGTEQRVRIAPLGRAGPEVMAQRFNACGRQSRVAGQVIIHGKQRVGIASLAPAGGEVMRQRIAAQRQRGRQLAKVKAAVEQAALAHKCRVVRIRHGRRRGHRRGQYGRPSLSVKGDGIGEHRQPIRRSRGAASVSDRGGSRRPIRGRQNRRSIAH